MFAGHFGLAAAIKARSPETPLWALMLSTQLIDVAFVPLLLTGTETMEAVKGASSYGGSVIHADYTHALASVLLFALAAGWLAGRQWGRKSGVWIGMTVFSHWPLDLIVHRADLPILPGNLGDLPLLGLGLWRYPGVSAALELLLVGAGAVLYAGSILRKRPTGSGGRSGGSVLAAVAVSSLLVLSLLTDLLGIG